jgi:hypothetical protein
MSNGWEPSAQAWIASMGERGERGDWRREHVLDPVMLSRVAAGRFDRRWTSVAAKAAFAGCSRPRM